MTFPTFYRRFLKSTIPFLLHPFGTRSKCLAQIALFLLLFPACSVQVKTTPIAVALTDGNHVTGGLIAVDSDLLVLSEDVSSASQVSSADEFPLTLIDFGLVDSVRILGGKYDRGGAVLGGLVGAVTGIFASGALDSASPNQERSRFAIGLGVGLVVGAGLGYVLGGMFTDSDIILAHPNDRDYTFLRQYAFYPDTIPPALELAIDSIEVNDESEQR
jgi:hypothetical protein